MARTFTLPESYSPAATEEKWRSSWEQQGVYRWDPTIPRERTFVVDTPPPTASGSLHIGHVFSYTQADVITRYHRMLGKNIFYPMGWDDNGLPTERRVQNKLGISCDPRLPYVPHFIPPERSDDKAPATPVARQNFIEQCARVTAEDEKAYERVFRQIGLSVDWSTQYATIDTHCRAVSQRSFLDLVQKGYVYHTESPTMWDAEYQSAIAQAELEDREIPGAFHDVRFGVEGGGELIIATTRPELIPACIAVVAHPDDKRYQHLFGKRAITPLFQVPVPIQPSTHADPEKGTGILMVCTFGDIADVNYWKSSGLPLRQVIGTDGAFLPITFGSDRFPSLNPTRANELYGKLTGLRVKKAQKQIVELLAEAGSSVDGSLPALVGEPKPIKHLVKFYEKGSFPIEFIPTRQWFIRILDFKSELLAQGRKIAWHPEHMLTRYENWVQGLNQDWCISRQRYFGVPFPVWYPTDGAGQPIYDQPIYASPDTLPVDPLATTPPGFDEKSRGVPHGFVGDTDVMDTWATSALTPQIASHWGTDPKRHAKLFPMDMRPQAHEIIRTWAFYTIVKAWMHEGQIPWKHAAISGFVMDPDRKKMSKSKGNVVTPEHILSEHSADAVRYWASRARLGIDTPFDASLFGIGRKLCTKIFNASKFVLQVIEKSGIDPLPTVGDVSEPLDCALLDELRSVISRATGSFEEFDFAAALQVSEDSFWGFCDNYVELVKIRAYDAEHPAAQRSAVATLALALSVYQRLFAPVLPYLCDEVWSWWHGGSSIHRAPWPTVEEVATKITASAHALDVAVTILSAIRGAKTAAKVGLKTPVTELRIQIPTDKKQLFTAVQGDILRAGNVASTALVVTTGGDSIVATVSLGSPS